jgi:WD40 repeat protein
MVRRFVSWLSWQRVYSKGLFVRRLAGVSGCLFAALACCAQTTQRARLVVQAGHGPLNAVALSRDGRIALTAGHFNESAIVWDVSTGRELRRLEGHTREINALAISPDGKRALTGSSDRTARLWDIDSGRELLRMDGFSDAVEGVAFSPSGQSALIAGDKTPMLWDLVTGQRLHIFEGHTGSVWSAGFSADGNRAITSSSGPDNTARIWNVRSGREEVRISSLKGFVTHAAISPNGRYAITGDDTGLRVWRIADSAPKELWHKEYSGGAISLAFSPNGRFVVSAGVGFIDVWDAVSGTRLTPPSQADSSNARNYARQSDALFHNAVFSADSQKILTANQDGIAQLWDLATGNELASFETYSSEVWSVAVSGDGQKLLAGGFGHAAQLWDLSAGKETRLIDRQGNTSLSVAFDDRIALTQSSAYGLYAWDSSTGLSLRHFADDLDPRVVATSPVGSLALVAGTSPRGRMIALFDVANGMRLGSLEGQTAEVQSAAFSADGRFALTAGGFDHTARLWDIGSRSEIRRFEAGANVLSVAFAPSGTLAVIGLADHTARLWDFASGVELKRLVGHTDAVRAVAFSRDGKLALTGSVDRTIREWNVATGEEVRRMDGDDVKTLAVSPENRFVFTSGDSGRIRLWDLGTGRHLATLVAFDNGGWAVTDPDGRYDSSDPDHAPGMHWVVDNRIVELAQLKRRFYIDGLLARILRGEELPGVASIQEVPVPPEVVASAPSPDGRSISVTLVNHGGGFGDLVTRINNRELGIIPVRSADRNANQVTIKVPVDNIPARADGNNQVEISAYDSENLVAGRGVILSILTPANQAPPRLFAIVVGTDYSIGDLHLNYAAKDAGDFAHAINLAARGMLQEPGSVDVRLISSAATVWPTKANIRRAFEEVIAQAKSGDILVVFFAGHGLTARIQNKDRYFYLTSAARSLDLPLADRALLDEETVSSEELLRWCMAVAALKQVIILDTCAAGSAGTDLVKLAGRREITPSQRQALERLKDAVGSHVLMGSAADSVSYESTLLSQGLLTYALLEGMRGGALSEGGQVDVRRLFDFTDREVIELSRRIGQRQQHPQISSPYGDTFPIGLIPTASRRLITLSTPGKQVTQPLCHDDADKDPLKLCAALREVLRETSTASNQAYNSAFGYVDQVAEIQGAFQPRISYRNKSERGSETIEIRVRLFDGADNEAWSTTISPATPDEKRSDFPDQILVIARGLVTAMVDALGRLPAGPP